MKLISEHPLLQLIEKVYKLFTADYSEFKFICDLQYVTDQRITRYPVKLLINADDLGYTPVLSHAIFDLHRRDRLFSTEFHHLIARPNITLEMIIHPGSLHDPEFPPDTLETYQRQWEYDPLTKYTFRRMD